MFYRSVIETVSQHFFRADRDKMVGELRRLYNYSQLYPNQVHLKHVFSGLSLAKANLPLRPYYYMTKSEQHTEPAWFIK